MIKRIISWKKSGAFILGSLFSFFFLNLNITSFFPKKSLTSFRIATLSLSGSTFQEEALEGFCSEIMSKSDKKIALDSYIADNQMMLSVMANDIVDKDYDLIYSIGAICTQEAKSITAKRKQPIPVVFAGVASPAKIGVVDSEQQPGGNLTGITLGNYAKYLIPDIAVHIKPSMKRVLIPWCIGDNGGVIEEDVRHLRSKLESRGIQVQETVVNGPSDTLEKVRPFIAEVDTLIIPVGSVVSQVTEGLSRLCDRYNVTLMGTVLSSIHQGAAVAWGLYCQKLGQACVPLVYKILFEKKNPAFMPVITMDDCHSIAVNVAAASRQGLPLTTEQIFCLKNGMVFGNSAV